VILKCFQKRHGGCPKFEDGSGSVAFTHSADDPVSRKATCKASAGGSQTYRFRTGMPSFRGFFVACASTNSTVTIAFNCFCAGTFLFEGNSTVELDLANHTPDVRSTAHEVNLFTEVKRKKKPLILIELCLICHWFIQYGAALGRRDAYLETAAMTRAGLLTSINYTICAATGSMKIGHIVSWASPPCHHSWRRFAAVSQHPPRVTRSEETGVHHGHNWRLLSRPFIPCSRAAIPKTSSEICRTKSPG
jgi:hypothetical protein